MALCGRVSVHLNLILGPHYFRLYCGVTWCIFLNKVLFSQITTNELAHRNLGPRQGVFSTGGWEKYFTKILSLLQIQNLSKLSLLTVTTKVQEREGLGLQNCWYTHHSHLQLQCRAYCNKHQQQWVSVELLCPGFYLPGYTQTSGTTAYISEEMI